MLIKKIINKLGFQISKIDNRKVSRPQIGLSNKLNREIWLEKAIGEIPKGNRILDAGAGELKYKKFCTHLDYVSQDFGQYNGKGDSAGLQTKTWDNSKLDIISDITKIPEADNSFDAIMCVEVFEHLPAPIEALKEFSRLLKINGTLIITAPFASLTHFAPYHFYSGFNKYFYEKHLVDLGFKIKELTPNGNYFEFLAQEIQLRVPNIYTDYKTTEKENQAINIVLNMLERMSETDKKSSELLTFGYHVKAKKIDNC